MNQTTPNLNNSLFKRLSNYTYVKVNEPKPEHFDGYYIKTEDNRFIQVIPYERVDNPQPENLANYYIKTEAGGFAPVDRNASFNPELIYYIQKDIFDSNLTYYIKIVQRYFPYIPEGEVIYEIDLNQRKINPPPFIAVKEDHSADIIWFVADRFFEDIDLYNGSCWIQYVNANKEKYFYNSPITVSLDKTGKEKIVIPWQISSDAAKKDGVVEFAIRFFKVSENNTEYDYILNTATAKTKVLSSLPNISMDVENNFETTEIRKLYDLFNSLNREYQVYWLEV